MEVCIFDVFLCVFSISYLLLVRGCVLDFRDGLLSLKHTGEPVLSSLVQEEDRLPRQRDPRQEMYEKPPSAKHSP